MQVESIDLVRSTEGATVFSTTIKNTGNKPVTGITLTFSGSALASTSLDPEPSTTSPLQPGQTTSGSWIGGASLPGTYVVGNTYSLVIAATLSDGSTFTYTASVMCRSA
ncbi:MAG: hypothetical protein M1503_02450 [Thaumarchaeota archaeon]|nr:hypothetical protein [Nitrososphaerota archaeon]MCL5317111.1 hypothetical protein [Nitrososphaerota archaeon]